MKYLLKKKHLCDTDNLELEDLVFEFADGSWFLVSKFNGSLRAYLGFLLCSEYNAT